MAEDMNTRAKRTVDMATRQPITTTLHTYCFDLSYPAQAEAYKALCAKLEATPGRGSSMVSWDAGAGHYSPFAPYAGESGLPVVLETRYLFDNQWNTAPIDGVTEKGFRVFDWAEDHHSSRPMGSMSGRNTRRGHYLDITPDMVALRHDWLKCGYCGAMEHRSAGLVFCPHCIDGEHLTESYLKLTRLRAVDDQRADFPELTAAERAERLPLYRAAQMHGATERGKARIAKLRRDIEAKRAKAMANATAEHDGMLWLLGHGFGQLAADNVIYYSHTSRFCFGWRKPLGEAELSTVLDFVSDFPFPYELKTADGRTLTGD